MPKKSKKPYSVTRRRIVNAAEALLGVKYLHQGRDAATGIDCVGLLVLVGKRIRYPEIFDLEDYRRVPSASKLIEMLRANLDEIPLSEVRAGDIYLMRLGGRKPRHTAIRVSDETDLLKGVEPMIVHALGTPNVMAVTKSKVRDFEQGFTHGFRVRGLK